jgi:prolyl 4-hydroxylase
MRKSKTPKISQRKHIENDKGLEIFTIPNFLTDEECDYLCERIEKNNTRSSVASEGNAISRYDEGRTSNTSNLPNGDHITDAVNQKMYSELGILEEYSEVTQGQIYQVGQEFRHHHDYFFGDGFINHCLASGQRTWTFMIYLNDVEEGGETDFPEIKTTIKPLKGMAVVWKNSDGKDTENSASLHAGLPVKQGKKMIITKWFREKIHEGVDNSRLAKEYHENQKQLNTKKTFSNAGQIPKLTEKGFQVVKIPHNTWRLIQEAYTLLQNIKTEENWVGIENFIHDGNGIAPVEIFNMDNCPRIKEIIQEELLPIHQNFIENKEAISPLWIYGIRSYKRGAILEPHTDTLMTHHVSSIIIVDKQVDEDWALDIQDHDGEWHKIYAEPGDMILYESAICKHGRKEPLNGEFYRNFYTHYKLADYTFQQ